MGFGRRDYGFDPVKHFFKRFYFKFKFYVYCSFIYYFVIYLLLFIIIHLICSLKCLCLSPAHKDDLEFLLAEANPAKLCALELDFDVGTEVYNFVEN